MQQIKLKVDVPEGESGIWKVARFVVSEREAKLERLRAVISSQAGRCVPEGTYTGLYRGGYTVMSDTPDEIRDHRGAIYEARGRVLIHGLGLGMCAHACLQKEEVDHLTIVEKSPDVIKLVGPWLTQKAEEHGKTLVIIEDDALTWKPARGERWDVVWNDIWDNLCLDNLEEMTKLHRRFGRRSNWVGSWGREILQRKRRSGW